MLTRIHYAKPKLFQIATFVCFAVWFFVEGTECVADQYKIVQIPLDRLRQHTQTPTNEASEASKSDSTDVSSPVLPASQIAAPQFAKRATASSGVLLSAKSFYLGHQYAKAEKLYRQFITQKQLQSGFSDPLLPSALDGLALVLKATKNVEEATAAESLSNDIKSGTIPKKNTIADPSADAVYAEGHAMDKSLNGFSHSQIFRNAFMDDASAIPMQDRLKLSPVLQPGNSGPEEIFAALYSSLHEGGKGENDKLLLTRFPQTARLLKERLAALSSALSSASSAPDNRIGTNQPGQSSAQDAKTTSSTKITAPSAASCDSVSLVTPEKEARARIDETTLTEFSKRIQHAVLPKIEEARGEIEHEIIIQCQLNSGNKAEYKVGTKPAGIDSQHVRDIYQELNQLSVPDSKGEVNFELLFKLPPR